MDWKKGCYASAKNPRELGREISWDEKKDKLIFRGSATGCGVTTQTNVRLRAALLAKKRPDILDIGIVDWNMRPKKYQSKSIQLIEPKKTKVQLKDKITDDEKFKYKYILCLDGHVSAFRLGSELASGSVIFIPKSKYSLWFSHMLKPNVHFVQVEENLSDLIEKVEWCQKNEAECKKMVENALAFYDAHFTRDALLSQFRDQLRSMSAASSQKSPKKIKQKTVAVITLFRDSEDGSRGKQKEHFLEIMPMLFQEKGVHAKIFVVEQSKEYDFNIGKLKNIGFAEANKSAKKTGEKFNHYIFTDIDVIPDSDLMEYYVNTPMTPTALAVNGTRYSDYEFHKGFPKSPVFGAAVSFTKEQFENVNGYSNAFYKWGQEDLNLAMRVHEKGYPIWYPRSGSIIDLEELQTGEKISAKEKVQGLGKDKREMMAFEKMKIHDTNGISPLN